MLGEPRAVIRVHDEGENGCNRVDACLGVVIRRTVQPGEQNGMHRHDCKRNTRIRVAQIVGEEENSDGSSRNKNAGRITRPSRMPFGAAFGAKCRTKPRTVATAVSETKYQTKGRAATFVAANESETMNEISRYAITRLRMRAQAPTMAAVPTRDVRSQT